MYTAHMSIVIATKNEQKYIARTLDHLTAAREEAEKNGITTELIVVDSSQDKATLEVARKYTRNVYRQRPQGVSKARNYGAVKSNGRVMVFMDADTIVQKNTLTDVYRIFKNESVVSAIAYVLSSRIHELSSSARLFYVIDKFYIKACGLIPLLIRFYNRGDIVAVRRSIFDQVQGFDESLYMMEVTDLLNQAIKHGKIKVLSDPVFESSRRLETWGVFKSYRIWWKNYFWFYLFRHLYDTQYEVVR